MSETALFTLTGLVLFIFMALPHDAVQLPKALAVRQIRGPAPTSPSRRGGQRGRFPACRAMTDRRPGSAFSLLPRCLP